MKIGDNIRKVRKKRGLTQKELAKLLNVSEPMVSQYESKETLKLETIKKVAKALEVSSFDLIDGYKVPVYQVKHINIELEPWALYYSNIFNTYKEKSDLFYTWYRRKKQEVSYELDKLKSVKFDFNIPFHDYGQDIGKASNDFFTDHINYLQGLINDLDYLFETLEGMYEEQDSFLENEFNKLVDKLKLENNKLLEELNKLENK